MVNLYYFSGETPRPSLVQEPTDQLAVKGANISLECLASTPLNTDLDSNSNTTIFWKHNNRILLQNVLSATFGSSGAFIETNNFYDRISNHTFTRGHLLLYNVNYNFAGKYQCIVSNRFGTTYSERFKVSIGSKYLLMQCLSNL